LYYGKKLKEKRLVPKNAKKPGDPRKVRKMGRDK
jgi:hypothetical protein